MWTFFVPRKQLRVFCKTNLIISAGKMENHFYLDLPFFYISTLYLSEELKKIYANAYFEKTKKLAFQNI